MHTEGIYGTYVGLYRGISEHVVYNLSGVKDVKNMPEICMKLEIIVNYITNKEDTLRMRMKNSRFFLCRAFYVWKVPLELIFNIRGGQ